MAPEAPSCAAYPRASWGVSRIVVPPMDLTWLGHACFRMRGREGIVLTDPPDPKSGHAIPRTEASLVTISHDHPGHASLKSVAGEPVVLRGPGEYEVHEVLVTGLGTFHDDDKGAARGPNTVFTIRLDDLVICHLGDLGHALAAADLERLGRRRHRARADIRRRHESLRREGGRDHPSARAQGRRADVLRPRSSEKGQPLRAPLT